jgi:hypothetical protein
VLKSDGFFKRGMAGFKIGLSAALPRMGSLSILSILPILRS